MKVTKRTLFGNEKVQQLTGTPDLPLEGLSSTLSVIAANAVFIFVLSSLSCYLSTGSVIIFHAVVCINRG